MINILIEPSYAQSMWCNVLLDSLTEQLKLKRIPYLIVKNSITADTDAFFMIATDFHWITDTIRSLNSYGIRPILLCNQQSRISGCDYSCVCSDMDGSVQAMIQELLKAGTIHIALYGVNPKSISDVGRIDSLFSNKSLSIQDIAIFSNSGSLEKCFQDFHPRVAEFDAVVCSNDFVAISLVRKLREKNPDELSRLIIYSCSSVKLSKYYSDCITTLSLNYDQYGKGAILIYELLQKNPAFSVMTLMVQWSYSKSRLPAISSKNVAQWKCPQQQETDPFYNDQELNEMLSVERLLHNISDMDQAIIHLINQGHSYSDIAEKCFLSENSVKYHIRKMIAITQSKDRDDFMKLLRKYIL